MGAQVSNRELVAAFNNHTVGLIEGPQTLVIYDGSTEDEVGRFSIKVSDGRVVALTLLKMVSGELQVSQNYSLPAEQNYTLPPPSDCPLNSLAVWGGSFVQVRPNKMLFLELKSEN